MKTQTQMRTILTEGEAHIALAASAIAVVILKGGKPGGDCMSETLEEVEGFQTALARELDVDGSKGMESLKEYAESAEKVVGEYLKRHKA
jgi:hypothetical protein